MDDNNDEDEDPDPLAGDIVSEDPALLHHLETTHDKVLRLINDVATRWNSTYFLLRRGLVLRESIDQYLTKEQADTATNQ